MIFFGQKFPPLSCLHCERRGAISTSPAIEIPVTSDHVVQFQPNIVIQITFGLFMNETLRNDIGIFFGEWLDAGQTMGGT